ncbi:DUF3592 domain-containing protein [Streptomyces sp. BE20]|uniref:DUF3592 domain-containing protein n=1 Tax=Streptomyces sp. BE20 TaxID=3002525 RepID=UPI002E772FAF|nr:DUF3592 domain-containing protein [Streptomyces sp. BE20]MEE1829245.1 DUF3592 domain-containing protein [Streptomyces sp. BE20]
METTTATVGGLILALFGGALLFWCAAEVRLRHRVRRRGVPTVATVVAESDPHGGLDSAPLLSYSASVQAGYAAPAAVRAGTAGTAVAATAAPGRIGELVLTRPRGRTPLRRPAGLSPGASVRIAYDPRRPGLAVLAAEEGPRAVVADLLWATLGLVCLSAGALLLVAASSA